MAACKAHICPPAHFTLPLGTVGIFCAGVSVVVSQHMANYHIFKRKKRTFPSFFSKINICKNNM